MSKIKGALAAAATVGLDELINSVPDPVVRSQLKTLSFAVKVPYAFFKELLPIEADEFISQVIKSAKLTGEMIQSPEFSQALGETLQNLTYAKDKVRRELIKKAFTGAYIGEDGYARASMERLQDVANRISLEGLQHLAFVKREILPILEQDTRRKITKGSVLPGFTEDEYIVYLKRTTPISHVYDGWHRDQGREIEDSFNRSSSEENRRAFDLRGAEENKLRRQFSEFWTEFNSFGIFRQGNDPAIGTMGGAGGSVQYLTEFGERFIGYIGVITIQDENG